MTTLLEFLPLGVVAIMLLYFQLGMVGGCITREQPQERQPPLSRLGFHEALRLAEEYARTRIPETWDIEQVTREEESWIFFYQQVIPDMSIETIPLGAHCHIQVGFDKSVRLFPGE